MGVTVLSTAADYIARCKELLSTAEANTDIDLGDDDSVWENALADALEQYNADRPYRTILQCSGDGTTRSFTLTGWVEAYSVIEPHNGVEDMGTASAGDYPPRYLDRTYWWTKLETDDTWTIRFRTAPGSGETYQVRYSVPHTIANLASGTATTVYTQDRRALSKLHAAKVCRAVQAERTKLGDDDAGEESLDLSGLPSVWETLGNTYQKEYDDHMTPGTDDVPAKGVGVAMVDRNPRDRGRWLTHHRG